MKSNLERSRILSCSVSHLTSRGGSNWGPSFIDFRPIGSTLFYCTIGPGVKWQTRLHEGMRGTWWSWKNAITGFLIALVEADPHAIVYQNDLRVFKLQRFCSSRKL